MDNPKKNPNVKYDLSMNFRVEQNKEYFEFVIGFVS